MDHGKMLLYVLVMLMGVMLFVLFQGYMMTLDTSAWTFLGHAEASAILQVTPTLFLITLILLPVYFIIKEAQ